MTTTPIINPLSDLTKLVNSRSTESFWESDEIIFLLQKYRANGNDYRQILITLSLVVEVSYQKLYLLRFR